MKTEKEYDVIVVGSGPGGATVAREMALKGKSVLLLERGLAWPYWQNIVSGLLAYNNFGVNMSKDLSLVPIPSTYGGATSVFCGCAVPPPKKVFDPVGIDLSNEAEELRKDMWIGELPDELIGDTHFKLMEAANDLGYNWKKTEKFVDSKKCVPDCPDCMLTCKRGAKWTARVFGDDAVANGAGLELNTTINEVIIENGKAIGVKGKKGFKGLGKPVEYYGKRIVLSSGMSNVGILRKAGIHEAGRTFAVDFLHFVGGISPYMDSSKAPDMTVADLSFYESDGVIIVPVWPHWAQIAILSTIGNPLLAPKATVNATKYTGIMVKVQDDLDGEIYPDNSVFVCKKPVTERDKKKLDKGVEICRRILRKVGCPDNSILVTPPFGAHPSASCRIGDVVDINLETRIGNLYCCDASVLPRSLGLPVVWTVAALGKRLGKHLDKSLAKAEKSK